jgi:hypothetical protein
MPEWKRLFTLDEAIATLAELRLLLTEIVEVGVLLSRAGQVDPFQPRARQNGHAHASPEAADDVAERLATRYRALVQRVLDMGIELKDPTTGLVDFPSLRDGRVVYLCWRLGESSIEYWHDLEAGFAGRQPL